MANNEDAVSFQKHFREFSHSGDFWERRIKLTRQLLIYCQDFPTNSVQNSEFAIMDDNQRIQQWCVLFLLLMKQIQASPVPKYTPTIIFDVNPQNNNNILFQDFVKIVSLNDVENRLGPLPARKKFAPRFAKNSKEDEKEVYQDKILFSDASSTNRGYIRTFPPVESQGQGNVNLRSLYPDSILLKSNSEEEKRASNKDFQLGNDMPSTTMNVMIPVEIPITNDSSDQDENVTEKSYNAVAPEVLEQLIGRDNKTKQMGNPSTEDESNKITFLSLFRVPNIDRNSDFPPCPENLRRNHHGDCVRPIRRIRYRVIEEEIRQIPGDED